MKIDQRLIKINHHLNISIILSLEIVKIAGQIARLSVNIYSSLTKVSVYSQAVLVKMNLPR